MMSRIAIAMSGLAIGVYCGLLLPMPEELSFADRWYPAAEMPNAKQLVPVPLRICSFPECKLGEPWGI